MSPVTFISLLPLMVGSFAVRLGKDPNPNRVAAAR